MANLEPLMERNFLEYASYVIVDRAIPDLRDGCKPVQRRILQTLHEMDDGKFHKVANVIGETMKLHPHGDASIGDALVVLANKDYFIEKQGNFGNVVTGHPAAAPRYIECRLNDLARETMFNKALTQFQPSYDGRKDEPIFLPVKLPVLLLLGTEGIAVGMSTKIFPHNLVELLQAQIAILEKKPFEVLPDFISGGQIDVSEYDSGLGKVRVRAKTEITSERKIVIKEIPYSTTTESLISSIELAAQKGRVQVSSINDFTTDHVEIELIPSRGVDPREVVPQLFAYTDCEVSLTSNIVTIQDQRPVELSTDNVLRFLTEQLKEQIRAELEFEINKLQSQRHWLTLERIFIEKRVYKRIEEAKTSDQVKAEVHTGMKLYRKQFIRSMTDEDVGRLLEIRIRRISRYDIEKTRQQLKEIDTQIKGLKGKLARLKKTTIELLENIIEKYGPDYPRKTEIAEFESVVRKTVALQDIKVSYDPETGFFGSAIKGSKYQMTVSEFDRILFVSKDGTYRIVDPAKKILIPDKVLHCSLFDQEEGRTFTVIYRDEKRMAFAKKVHIQKFIRQKEYSLVPGKKGKLDFLLPGDTTGIFQLNFVPAKNQRVHEGEFDIGILEITNPLAKGRRMATKPVARIIRFTKEELQALKRKRKRRSAKR